ncbi:MAG: class II fructose-bisphosphate aldolase [Parcubacteria group bacterium]|nr:class II fructose-bisphosphate aldolase [Parcubacteria group bacterium]
MSNLNQVLKEAESGGYAIPHFNFANMETLKACVEAAKELNSPLMLGTSEGERKFFGRAQAVSVIKAFQKELEIQIFLNADHTKSFEEAKLVIDLGYDSVIIDLAHLSFEENVKITKQVVEYAKSKNPDISVEGELGYLLGESKILKEKIELKPENYTKPEQAFEFWKETKVDRLTVAVGNIHGVSIAGNPRLDIGLIQKTKKLIPEVLLTLHGGSGIANEEIKQAVKAGMSNVHYNTDLRVSYLNALKKAIGDLPEETTPYKLFGPVIEAVKKTAKDRIELLTP